MNKIILTGYLATEPELVTRQGTNGPFSKTSFRIAVNRPTKENKADFIDCVTLGKTAEFIQQYFHKGMKMDLSGSLYVDQYQNQNGENRSHTYVYATNVEFGESRNARMNSGSYQTNQQTGYIPATFPAANFTPPNPSQTYPYNPPQTPVSSTPTPAPATEQIPTPDPAPVPTEPVYAAPQQPAINEGFMMVPDSMEDELPFN